MRKTMFLPPNFLSKKVEKEDIRCLVVGMPINCHELIFLVADHKGIGPIIHGDHFIGNRVIVDNLDLVEILNEADIPVRGISVASLEQLAFDQLEDLHEEMNVLTLNSREEILTQIHVISPKNKVSYIKHKNISKREINGRNRQMKGIFRKR